ncbi:hypothetical protein [Streptomyces sp. NPDC054786]
MSAMLPLATDIGLDKQRFSQSLSTRRSPPGLALIAIIEVIAAGVVGQTDSVKHAEEQPLTGGHVSEGFVRVGDAATEPCMAQSSGLRRTGAPGPTQEIRQRQLRW